MEAAIGLADCWNSSLTKNQGMEPGPVAKLTTNMMTNMMERYEETEVCSKQNIVQRHIFMNYLQVEILVQLLKPHRWVFWECIT